MDFFTSEEVTSEDATFICSSVQSLDFWEC